VKDCLDTTAVDSANSQIWASADGGPQHALETSLSLRQRALELRYPRGVAESFLNSGYCNSLLLDHITALSELHRALKLLREVGDERLEARALNELGKCHYRLGDYDSALDHYEKALEIRRAMGDAKGVAASLNNIGLLHFDCARYLDSHRCHSESVTLHESAGNPAGAAIALNNLGLAYQQLGDDLQAMICHRESLRIKEGLGNTAGVCASLNNLGQLYRKLGEQTESLKMHRRALELAQTAGHRFHIGQALVNIGEAYQAAGDLARALDSFESGLGYMVGAGEHYTVAEALIAMGRNMTGQAHHEQAVSYLERAAEVASSLGARELSMKCHQALCECHESAGRYDRALEHHKEFHRAHARIVRDEVDLRRRVIDLQIEMEQVSRQADTERAMRVQLAEANRQLELAATERAELMEKLLRLSIEDPLTGIANRRRLEEALSQESSRALRFGHGLCVAMLDIDNFKRINDRYHHHVGDEVLRTVATLLCNTHRELDLVGRYGGEEFLSLMVEASLDDAELIAERVREAVAAFDWGSLAPGLSVTVSVGVAALGEAADAQGVVNLADSRLYLAKSGGRNRVCAA